MSSKIVTTFLELGDATSRNLKFSHRKDVFVSYGEETITENNLLEIRRRHPDRVYLETFSRAKEAQSGADWEWHIVGRQWTLKMRVQAKRVQSDDKLKIKHKVGSSGKQQKKVLLDGAKADNIKPLYCIYCSESQRSFWTQSHPMGDFEEGYQTGCLLADANGVPVKTRELDEIERKCIPWHYLFERANFAHCKHELVVVMPGHEKFIVSDTLILSAGDSGSADNRTKAGEGWNAPTIADLNGEADRDFDHTGVAETNAEARERLSSAMEGGTYLGQDDRARLRDRGIHRMLVIDVRDEAVFGTRRDISKR